MARWLEQKVLKQKRMRIAYLKKYGPKIDPHEVARKQAYMQEAQARAKGKWKDLPKTIGLSEPNQNKIKRYLELLEGVPTERHIVAFKNEYIKILLFFSPDSQRWFFIELNKVLKTLRKSWIYSTGNLAKDAYRRDCILWTTTEENFLE